VRRDLLVLAGFVGSGIVAGAAYESWRSKRRDRLDVYFDDGSFVTYVDGSSEAERLLPFARQVLVAAHAAPVTA
jgi:hypothetical protein